MKRVSPSLSLTRSDARVLLEASFNINMLTRHPNPSQAAEELDRLSKTMGYMEKGMIRVKGILEGEAPEAPVVAVVEEAAAPQETEA